MTQLDASLTSFDRDLAKGILLGDSSSESFLGVTGIASTIKGYRIGVYNGPKALTHGNPGDVKRRERLPDPKSSGAASR